MSLPATRSFSLSPDEIRTFHERGYAGPFTAYTPEEMAATWRKLRLQLLDRSKAIYPQDTVSASNNIANYDRHLDNDFLADHICHPAIAHKVRGILGPNVICWRSEFFPKYPGDEGTDWHQADTFANASGRPQIIWPEDEEFGGTITVWTAFTPATKETGCLRFIPGTHKTMFYDESKGMSYDPDKQVNLEKGGVRRGFFGYDYRQLQIDPNWEPDESQAIDMELQPGQFVMFWSTLMHSSWPHSGKSKDLRLGFVGRYVPTQVRVYPDTELVLEYGGAIPLDQYGAVLVCGENTNPENKMRTETTRGKRFVPA
jgi:non-heme Fe2+,alpha-ketoglutarate-dependent halogenase